MANETKHMKELQFVCCYHRWSPVVNMWHGWGVSVAGNCDRKPEDLKECWPAHCLFWCSCPCRLSINLLPPFCTVFPPRAVSSRYRYHSSCDVCVLEAGNSDAFRSRADILGNRLLLPLHKMLLSN